MTRAERPPRDSHVPMPALVQTLRIPAQSQLNQTLRLDPALDANAQFVRFDSTDDAVTSFLPIEALRSELPHAEGPPADGAAARSWQQDDERVPSNGRERGNGVLAAWRKTSGVTRACLLLLPLIALVWGLPRVRQRFRQHEPEAVAAPPSSLSAPALPATSSNVPTAEQAAVDVTEGEPQPLPASLERMAADRIAAGDPKAALTIYRDLAARQPNNAAFREAVRILATSEVTP